MIAGLKGSGTNRVEIISLRTLFPDRNNHENGWGEHQGDCAMLGSLGR